MLGLPEGLDPEGPAPFGAQDRDRDIRQRTKDESNHGPQSLSTVLYNAGVHKHWPDRRAIIRMLCPDPLGPDGYPVYFPMGGRVEPSVSAMWWMFPESFGGTGAKGPAQRHRYEGRAIIAAVYRDMLAQPAQVVGARILGLKEAREYDPERDGAAELRGTRRTIAIGRGLLHALGAWPWTHATPQTFRMNDRDRPTATLPARWWTLPVFIDPLARWHHAAWQSADAIRVRAEATFAPAGRAGSTARKAVNPPAS